jgi:FkbM family methyltransferase
MNACVYTCLIGRYEKLNEQPVARDARIPFVCLTDDPDLVSETWQIVHVAPALRADPVRSQRLLKMLPYRHLPGVERSLYIDNSVVLSAPPEEVFARYLPEGSFAAPTHSYRPTVADEFAEVSATRLDNEARIAEQFAHYEASDPACLRERPFWSAILLRDHRDAHLRDVMEAWSTQVLRYSRRDQLSLNYVLREQRFDVRRIEIDNFVSWFHTWPVTVDRKAGVRALRPYSPVFTDAPFMRVMEDLFARRQAELTRDLERTRRDLAARTRDIETLWASRSWRLTAPLRALRARLPLPAAPARPHAAPDDAPARGAALSVVTANGRRIFADPHDQRAGALVRAGGDFNPTSLHIWRALCAENDWTHIVDVGANYGEMIVAVDFPHGADVIALEPNPYVLPYLLRTLRESGERVEVFAAAASDGTGTAAITIDRDWSGSTSLIGGQAQSAGHTTESCAVPTVTLDQLIDARRTPPARLLVKIDAEGHEAAVLRGLGDRPEQMEDFAALVEVLHLGDADLDWIAGRFSVSLYDRQDGCLTLAAAADATALRGLLNDDRYYAQDIVVRAKPRA